MDNREIHFFSYYFYKLKQFCLQFDYLQIIPLFALMGIGVLFIYGTGQQIGIAHYENAWLKQLVWIGLGMSAWLFLAVVDYRKLTIFIWPLYGLSLFLLTLVLQI